MKLFLGGLLFELISYQSLGVLRISSDSDDRKIFLGLKFSISGYFLGRKILAIIFLGSLIEEEIFGGTFCVISFYCLRRRRSKPSV